MAAALADILAELDRLLEPGSFRDWGPNGLQVPGPAEVRTLATGVSAHLELFERARDAGADLVLVHHGIFWSSQPQAIDETMKARLKLLFDSEIALAAYHLPLDSHPELGNNALLARAIGAHALEPFARHHERTIGFIAELPGGVEPSELFARVRAATEREPLVIDAGPPTVRRVAIVTGAGADYLVEAIDAGAEAFITGEPAERVMAQAKEGHVHFVAAGHYATETFGVRALGEHLRARFDVGHVFLDVPNPI
jgi:dinuclear metal center YbgI/SA1388 family protein